MHPQHAPCSGRSTSSYSKAACLGEKTNMAQAKNNTKLGPTNSIKGGMRGGCGAYFPCQDQMKLTKL